MIVAREIADGIAGGCLEVRPDSRHVPTLARPYTLAACFKNLAAKDYQKGLTSRDTQRLRSAKFSRKPIKSSRTP